MKTLFLFLVSFTLHTSYTFANQSSEISRESLFKRAFSSTGYFMLVLQSDSDFIKSLNANEKEMFSLVSKVSNEIRTREWLIENQIPNYPAEGKDRFYYGFVGSLHERNERTLAFTTAPKVDLIFSRDQELFKIHPGEPTRTAVTETATDKPIFINLTKINSREETLDLPAAVQIMIHEFGHKLGDKKNQTAVDSMATKVRAFLAQKTTHKKLKEGTFSFLSLPFKNWGEWMEVTLQGRYKGVNIPNQIEPLQIVSGEGFYALFSGDKEMVDLSPSFQNEVKKLITFQPYLGMPFQWRNVSWFDSDAFTVRKTLSDQIVIEANILHYNMVMLFIAKGDPDQRSYLPWSRIFEAGEALYRTWERTEWTLDLKSGKLSTEGVWARSLVKEEISNSATRSNLKETADFIHLRYQLKAPAAFKNQKPLLVTSLGDGTTEERFEIPGQWISQEVEFAVPKKALKGTLQIRAIDFMPAFQDVTNSQVNESKRVYLEKSEALQLAEEKPLEALQLSAVYLFQNQKWVPLTEDSNYKTSQLKFVFQSTQPLMSLRLLQKYRTKAHITSVEEIRGNKRILGQGEVTPPEFTRLIVIEARDLEQMVRGNQLEVIVQVDKNLTLETFRRVELELPDLPGYIRGPDQPHIFEETKTTTRPERTILAIEAQTADFQSKRVHFKSNLSFVKQ